MSRYAMPSLRKMRKDAERRNARPGVHLTPEEMEFRMRYSPMGGHQFIAGSILCVWCRSRLEDSGAVACIAWQRRNV